MKIFLIVCTLLLLLGFIGLNILAYNHARAMTTYVAAGTRTSQPERLSRWQRIAVLLKGVTITRPESNLAPESLAEQTRMIRIPVNNTISLEAWYKDLGPHTPLVLLFHGYADDKTDLLQEARTLLGMDASVLLMDLRGSGGSTESYSSIGYYEAEDVTAALQYAREHCKHSHYILFGQSKGAVALLRAIAHHGIAPDGVIIEAVFDTMLRTVRNRFRAMRTPSFPNAELLVFWGGRQRGFNAFKHNPVRYARALTVPALFMHGENDPRATLTEGRRVFDAAPGPKQWVTFAQSGHESYVDQHPERWQNAVSTFIRSLSGNDTTE
jgi:uncharacterized protein